MKIKKTLETENGGVTFEGELNSEELDLIIGIGLNLLMKQGAIPFRVVKLSDLSTVIEPVETQQ